MKSGLITSLRFYFAFLGINERKELVTTIDSQIPRNATDLEKQPLPRGLLRTHFVGLVPEGQLARLAVMRHANVSVPPVEILVYCPLCFDTC